MNSRSMILAAAALMITATACNKSEEPATQPQGVSFSLSFDGTTSPETRVVFEDDALTGQWERDDIVYVCLNLTDGKVYGPFEATPDAAGERASFKAEINGVPADTKIAGIDAYHYDNLDEVKFADGAIKYSLPASNNGTLSYLTVSSFDYSVGSKPEVIDGGEIDITETLTFTQRLARLDIKTDLSIKEITLSLTDAAFPTSASLNVADDNTSATVSDDMIRINPAVDKYYQIGLVPVSFGSGKTMKATVITTNSEAYTREVTVSAFEKAKRYTLDLSEDSAKQVTPISDEEALKAMSGSDGDFVLTADITLKEIPNIQGFQGSLDGNGYKISLPETSSVEASEAGIFGSIANNVTITNLYVDAKTLTMNTRNGGIIAGSVTSGTITLNNVHVTGTVTASQSGEGEDNHIFAGGLVGFVKNGAFIAAKNCSFSGTITANQPKESIAEYQYNSYVGGIVGSVESGIEEFVNDTYQGSEAGNGSTITNCYVTNSTISNLIDGETDWPYASERATEIYTGGIAGRCTGLIIDCSVRDTNISGVRSDNGYRKMIKPILGNDYYEHINNDNNSYTNVTINGEAPMTGMYRGSKAAGTDTPSYTPSYSDL